MSKTVSEKNVQKLKQYFDTKPNSPKVKKPRPKPQTGKDGAVR